MSSNSTALFKSNTRAQPIIPSHMKYQKNKTSWVNPNTKLKPSELMNQTLLEIVAEDYPLIVELISMNDNTSQLHSSVDIDEPLFRPSPTVLVFEDYAPFAVHEKKLFFRNSDKVRDYQCIILIRKECLIRLLAASKYCSLKVLSLKYQHL